MDTYLRTIPLPGAVRPVREHGASALDRTAIAWPAPDPAARVLDRWGMPIIGEPAAWPAPDPVMRFELAAPELGRQTAPADGRIPRTELIEPRTNVAVPDLRSAASAAIGSSNDVRTAPAWPAPTLDTAAPIDSPEAPRGRFSNRVIAAAVVAAGTIAAGAVAAVALL